MQGIVFDIKRFAIHDGPGIRTTVFFKGCNIRCLWCHNPESIEAGTICSVKKVLIEGQPFDHPEVVGDLWTVPDLVKNLLRDLVFMEESGGGITISGGEPTMQPEFLLKLLEACKKEGLHTAVDTNGFVKQEILEQISRYTDLFLYDIKHHDPEKHKEGTGVPNQLVLSNLKFLIENGNRVRVRIPVIPGFNYNSQDLAAMVEIMKPFLGGIDQVDILPFHNIAQHKYKRFGISNQMDGVTALRTEDMTEARGLFEKGGFRVKIGG